MSDLVGNPEDRFSPVAAHMIIFCKLVKLMKVQTTLCKGAFLAGDALMKCGVHVNRLTWHRRIAHLSSN